MQKYTTIIGVLKMKGDGFTYEDIQSRFGIGSSTVNRTLSTMRKLGLTYEELSKKSPDEVEQLFYPSEKAYFFVFKQIAVVLEAYTHWIDEELL